MRIAIKVIGFVHVGISFLILIGMFYISNLQGIAFVTSQTFKVLLYSILLALSGMGLILKNRILFYAVFYLYPIFILDNLFKIYKMLSMDKIEAEPDVLYAAIRGGVINTSICIFIGLVVFIFLILKKNLQLIKIPNLSLPVVHSFFAICFFLIFTAFIF